MRISLVGPCHPFRGGIAHYTTSLYRALEDAGHQVQTYNFSRQYPDVLFPGTTQEDHSKAPFEMPNDRCVDTLNPVSWAYTGWRIARSRPELTIIQWWHPYFAPSFGTIARIVRRASRSQIVFLCHNVLPHESSLVDKGLIRWAFRSSDSFLVQAAKERAKLRELVGYKPQIEVVPHPTYDVFAEQGGEVTGEEARAKLRLKGERILLFFGYVRPYKGLSVLLNALPLLKTSGIQLVIAGECYEDKQKYLNLLQELRLEDRVLFLDKYIPNEEVRVYFAAADLVVLPYRSATQSGIVQVAYAFGVPVVVSDVGGIPEIVQDGETGLLVPPERPGQLAAAIDRFFREDLSEQLTEGIRRKREAFRWDSVVTALTQLGGH